MENIPIIDCSEIEGPIENISNEKLSNFAEKIGSVMSGIGFTYLINHGLDLTKIDKVFDVSKKFFDMSPEVKRKVKKPAGATSCHGYSGPGDELLNENEPNAMELREFFDVTCHIRSNDLAYFPKEVPAFKPAFDEARIECAKVAEKILHCLALYLGLDGNEIVKRHKNLYNRQMPTQTVMRTSMYSAVDKSSIIPAGSIRCGEHCDWHTITLLFQDSVGGLEVRGTSGEWVSAIPIKDAIVINSGQLLEIYSGGRLPATPHRVRILDEEILLNKPRQSMIYCPSPDAQEDVEPLVSIPKELNGKVRSIYGPQSYEKVNAYEWVDKRQSTAARY